MNVTIKLFSAVLISAFLYHSNSQASELSIQKVNKLFTIEQNVDINPLYNNEGDLKLEFTFINNEGDIVNGVFLKPFSSNGHQKFALALHPMGDSHSFWWRNKSNLNASHLSDQLRRLGFTVVALDARLHGQRKNTGFGPRELLANAHSDDPSTYNEAITGTVRDYRSLLSWIHKNNNVDQLLAIGYSMGAQMSLLLSHYEPSISHVLAMVPPFVKSDDSPVAPRVHTPYITNANVLMFAAKEDQFSTQQNIQDTFDLLPNPNKEIKWFDSGHRLPMEYIEHAKNFINKMEQQ